MFIESEDVFEWGLDIFGEGAVAPGSVHEFAGFESGAGVNAHENSDVEVVAGSDQSVAEYELACGKTDGVGTEFLDAADGGLAGRQGKGERVGSSDGQDCTHVGKDASSEDAHYDLARVCGWFWYTLEGDGLVWAGMDDCSMGRHGRGLVN